MMDRRKSRSLFYYSIVVAVVAFESFVLNGSSMGMASHKEPTAVVMDAETGEPIEDAVAIAIWRKKDLKKGTWFEGGGESIVRIEEVVSDKEGKIYIEDFWDWHLFKGRYPRLTIYKPGYVCWDQELVYIEEHMWEERLDFNKENRVVHIKKWPKGFSFNGHGAFVDHCTGTDYYEATRKLFLKAFEYETPSRIFESTIRNKKRKEKKWRER